MLLDDALKITAGTNQQRKLFSKNLYLDPFFFFLASWCCICINVSKEEEKEEEEENS